VKSKLNKFLRYLQTERGFSQGTIEAYQLDIEKGLIPFLHQQGKSDIAEVTKDDIRAYLDYLAVNRGNSSVTRAWKLAAIKSFFNYLVETEELKANPASSIRSPRILEMEPEYLTEKECICLLETIARRGRSQVRERDIAMVVLFLHTGLRVSELTSLKLVNVDLGRGQIKITRKGNKATVSQVILDAQRQGYTVLGWDQHQKLLDEIHKLIGGDDEQGRIIGPPGIVGIVVTTTRSPQGVKILPKSSPF
jgi:site-specific recombinase XerD